VERAAPGFCRGHSRWALVPIRSWVAGAISLGRYQQAPTMPPSRSQAGTKLSAALSALHSALATPLSTQHTAHPRAPSPSPRRQGLSWPGTLACGGGGATSTVIVMARKTGAYDAPGNSRGGGGGRAVLRRRAGRMGGWQMADGQGRCAKWRAWSLAGWGARVSLVSRQPQQRLRGQGWCWWRQ
jgi:hypothetical protein